ncbi:MAG: hypothetical protein WA398_04175, partial [Nitrososphaeraceae archaeon]
WISYSFSDGCTKDDKLYDIGFLTAPLKAPEMGTIGEKTIQTFQFNLPIIQAHDMKLLFLI